MGEDNQILVKIFFIEKNYKLFVRKIVVFKEKKVMNKYMKIAKELAEKNLITNVGGPFGACVIKDGEIIGKGSNHVLSTHPATRAAKLPPAMAQIRAQALRAAPRRSTSSAAT